MTIDFDMPDGKKYNMDIDLFQSIDSEASKFKVMGTKLELSLKK